MPEFSLIVAHDKNNLIGNKGSLPWKLPEDLRHFKQTTMGKPLLMGRKTFESIGSKPLPGRPCYVLSKKLSAGRPLKNRLANKENAFTVFESETEAISYFNTSDYDEVVIVGGAETYKLFLPHCNRLIISLVYGEFTGDTYFPDYSNLLNTSFKLSSSTSYNDFQVLEYKRIS
ncbi:MAG: dihydrofolate reductase [Balneolales bacterium]|nr:dihydrofolate reductase [Balneolales bacterium]